MSICHVLVTVLCRCWHLPSHDPTSSGFPSHVLGCLIFLRPVQASCDQFHLIIDQIEWRTCTYLSWQVLFRVLGVIRLIGSGIAHGSLRWASNTKLDGLTEYLLNGQNGCSHQKAFKLFLILHWVLTWCILDSSAARWACSQLRC